jgi:hypothetical protein
MVASVAAVTEPKTWLQENRLLGRFFFVPLDVRGELDAMFASGTSRSPQPKARRGEDWQQAGPFACDGPVLYCFGNVNSAILFPQGLLPNSRRTIHSTEQQTPTTEDAVLGELGTERWPPQSGALIPVRIVQLIERMK